MPDRIYNVLFLCTHNSARSVLAEAIVNHVQINGGRFKGYSAGSHPSGTVNALALEQIAKVGLPVEGIRSKDWSEFEIPGAPVMDFVFTVCDNAANEVCPVWPGQPMTAHWGMPDPAAVEGSDVQKRQAFARTFSELRNRINTFANLPMEKLDRLTLKAKLDEIGKSKS
ncbi:MAG: arsenate reductase ArsC [Burkholderiales bacterium]